MREHTASRPGQVQLAWLLGSAILTRGITVGLKPPGFPPGWGGEMAAVAYSLSQGEGFGSPYLGHTGPTALVPPVYPWILSGMFRLAGYSPTAGMIALGLNVLLSAAAVLPLFWLGRRLFGTRVGLGAAWLWSLLPLSGFTDAQFVWNTSLFILLLLSFLALTVSLEGASSRRWAGYGVLTGLLILTEPVSLAMVVPATVWLARRRWSSRGLLVALVIAAIPSTGWLIRNQVRFERPVFLRSGLGLELSVGTRQDEFRNERLFTLPNRDSVEYRRYASLGEPQYVGARKAEALSWITSHPGEYLVRTGKRVLGFWSGLWHARSLYFLYGRFPVLKTLFYSLWAVAAFIGLIRLAKARHPATWLFIGIFACYPAVYYLTHVMPRYRLPLEPLMVLLAVAEAERQGLWRRVLSRARMSAATVSPSIAVVLSLVWPYRSR